MDRNWLIPRQALLPFSEVKCGTRRKRRALEIALEKDVYTKELEKHYRTRRQATEEVACVWNKEVDLFSGKHYTSNILVC
jgi:hypothetical protein